MQALLHPKRDDLEKSQCLGAIAHQQILRLLIVFQHHAVGFPTDARPL